MDADAPATQDVTRCRTFVAPKLRPAAAAPQTRRCPMPGTDPQTGTMAITHGQLPHNAESRL
jgi:hypothetical protein